MLPRPGECTTSASLVDGLSTVPVRGRPLRHTGTGHDQDTPVKRDNSDERTQTSLVTHPQSLSTTEWVQCVTGHAGVGVEGAKTPWDTEPRPLSGLQDTDEESYPSPETELNHHSPS